ncbi:MAG: NAD(P)/FAD-dependent oxidoreductase, partial [Acidimicrobiales bacterium]|nr:NAD(P)/FAD-dependent oxidoreductase [Acidimicrobiales bacterium]
AASGDRAHPQPMTNDYDVVVVGGGPAGLNGALVLARARRSVLVIDAGQPRNAPAAGVHGFLTRDGTPPAELSAIGRKEVRRYGGTVVDGRATTAARAGAGFTVTLDDGTAVGARRLLVTTGLVDELPDIPGLRERWGDSVIHCPYCHGWEVRDKSVGVLATTWFAVQKALLVRQWVDDLTLLLHTQPEPDDTQLVQLAARDVRVVRGEVVAFDGAGAHLRHGEVVPLQALAVAPRMIARSELLTALGLTPTPNPMGEFIAADPTGLTAVPGVWVAGNVADLMAQVLSSAAAGAAAAAAINADLIAEDVERAVKTHRGLVPR